MGSCAIDKVVFSYSDLTLANFQDVSIGQYVQFLCCELKNTAFAGVSVFEPNFSCDARPAYRANPAAKTVFLTEQLLTANGAPGTAAGAVVEDCEERTEDVPERSTVISPLKKVTDW